jgi:hypothetical protein
MGLRNQRIDSDSISVSSNKKDKENIRIGSKDYWSPAPNDKNPSATFKFESNLNFTKFSIFLVINLNKYMKFRPNRIQWYQDKGKSR